MPAILQRSERGVALPVLASDLPPHRAHGATPGAGPVVLDSEGLSAWVAQDRKTMAMFPVFHEMGADLAVGANTIVAVSHSRVNLPRLRWALSRVKVEPVAEGAAKATAQVCKAAGPRRHDYALDSTVAEAALRQPRRSPCSRRTPMT